MSVTRLLSLPLAVLALAGTLAARPAPAQERTPRRFALLVGISSYRSAAIPKLYCADEDALKLAPVLRKHGYETRVLSSKDREPVSKKRILATLQELGSQSEVGDLFFFFFSGHGMQVGTGISSEAFLITQDTDGRTPEKIRATALSSNELNQAFDGIAASKRVFLFDACRTAVGRTVGENSKTLQTKRPVSSKDLVLRTSNEDPDAVSFVAYSCTDGKQSYEWLEKKRGYFSYFVEEALTGKAGDPERGITFASVFNYIKRKLPEATRNLGMDAQVPIQRAYGQAFDVLLVDARAAQPKPSTAQPAAPAPSPIPLGPVLTAIPAARKHALIIGMSDYRFLPVVPTSIRDAEQLAQVLQEKLGFPKDQITLLTDQKLGRLQLRAELEKVAQRLGPDSVVLFYYAGHGKRMNGQDYLVLPQAEEHLELLEKASFSIEQIMTELNAKAPRQALAFVDMCRYMGQSGTSNAGFPPRNPLLFPARASVIYACGENEVSRLYRSQNPSSAFVHFVMAGLQGDPKAADSRGAVTLESLQSYLRDSVSRYVSETYQARQTPGGFDRSDGLVLAALESRGAAPAPNTMPAPAIPNMPVVNAVTPGAGVGRTAQNRPQPLVLPELAPPFKTERLDRKAVPGHTDRVVSLAFDTAGQLLASGGGREVCLWNMADGSLLRTLEGAGGALSQVALSPDGKTVAALSAENALYLWKAEDGTLLHKLEGHTAFVPGLAFSPDGKTVVTGSWDNSVRVWDVATGTPRVLEGHSNFVNAVAFSPDGKTLASASADRTVRLWDAVSWTPAAVLQGHGDTVKCLQFSPDGSLLATGSADRTVRLWDAWTGAPAGTLEGLPALVGMLAFSPDGEQLAAVSLTQVGVWSVKSRELLRHFGKPEDNENPELSGHGGAILGLAFAPDGKTVATGSEDSKVFLWDVQQGRKVKELPVFSDVFAVAFSARGTVLAGGCAESKVVLWRPMEAPAPAVTPAPAAKPQAKPSKPVTPARKPLRRRRR